MDLNEEIVSSDDELYFSLFKENASFTSATDTDSSRESEDIIGPVKKKIRVTETESETETDFDVEEDSEEWIDVTESEEIPHRQKFKSGVRPAGPHITSNITEPLHFFKLYFTDELINEIIDETNRYAKSKLKGKILSNRSIWKNWRDVSREEVQAFIAVILNMGTMELANIQEYWSMDSTSRIPFYPNVFTRDRFTQIFWMLHLKTGIQRVSSFLDYINSKYLEYFVPGENLCVNESVVKLKGKIVFLTYNPNKPTKKEFRIYVLVDCETGYICGILPYYGSLTTDQLIKPDLPISTRIPLHLYKMLLDQLPGAQGHHMFTGKYYTSITLAKELYNMGCHLTGAIKTNRKGLPITIKKPKFQRNKTVAYKRRNTLLLSWKKKRVVTMLTNWNNAGFVSEKRFDRNGVDMDVKKPSVIIHYMKHMKAVDRINQYTSSYCFLKKSLKLWRKLFFWGLEICVLNSYTLYKLSKKQRNESPLNRLKYVKLLVKQLRDGYGQERDRSSTSSQSNDNVRLNGKLHIILTGKKQDCKVCSRRDSAGKRHATTYFCDTCPGKPRMHMGECFIKYHTIENYKL